MPALVAEAFGIGKVTNGSSTATTAAGAHHSGSRPRIRTFSNSSSGGGGSTTGKGGKFWHKARAVATQVGKRRRNSKRRGSREGKGAAASGSGGGRRKGSTTSSTSAAAAAADVAAAAARASGRIPRYYDGGSGTVTPRSFQSGSEDHGGTSGNCSAALDDDEADVAEPRPDRPRDMALRRWQALREALTEKSRAGGEGGAGGLLGAAGDGNPTAKPVAIAPDAMLVGDHGESEIGTVSGRLNSGILRWGGSTASSLSLSSASCRSSPWHSHHPSPRGSHPHSPRGRSRTSSVRSDLEPAGLDEVEAAAGTDIGDVLSGLESHASSIESPGESPRTLSPTVCRRAEAVPGSGSGGTAGSHVFDADDHHLLQAIDVDGPSPLSRVGSLATLRERRDSQALLCSANGDESYDDVCNPAALASLMLLAADVTGGGEQAEGEASQQFTEWVHPGKISRQMAETRLREAGMVEGGFLLRSMGAHDQFALAVCTGERVLHHLISRRAGTDTGDREGGFQLNGASGPFVGKAVQTAVRTVLRLDGVETIFPVYPRSKVFSL
jgi:hypothetical protein